MIEVDLATFSHARSDAAVVIDVREPHEYMIGHAAHARVVLLGHVPACAAEIRRGEAVYVICANGNRSRIAAAYLDWLGVRV